MELFVSSIPTPLGSLTAVATKDETLVRLTFDTDIDTLVPGLVDAGHQARRASEPPARLCQELASYFNGERECFTVPVAPKGTLFEQRVWQELQALPYGRTLSYAELSRRIGDAKAVRAVGRATGKNPIAIVIPCHRVLGSNGSLTGYAGGLHRKRALLMLERTLLA